MLEQHTRIAPLFLGAVQYRRHFGPVGRIRVGDLAFDNLVIDGHVEHAVLVPVVVPPEFLGDRQRVDGRFLHPADGGVGGTRARRGQVLSAGPGSAQDGQKP